MKSNVRKTQGRCSSMLFWKALILIGALAVPRISNAQANAKPALVLQTGHTEGVYAVAFGPENRWLASASGDNTVKIWDLRSGLELRTLRGHTDGVKAVAFSPDGRLVASGSDDNNVKLWEVTTGRELFTMATGNHVMGIMDVAFDSDGKRLISLNQDRTVTIWDVATGQPISSFSAGRGNGTAYFTRLTRNGHWVMSDGNDEANSRAVQLWDVTTGERVYSHIKRIVNMNNPTLSPDGRWLVSTDEHMSIQLWDVAKGLLVYSLYGDPAMETNATFDFAFSPDGKVLAVGDDKKQTLRLLDAANGRELRRFEKMPIFGGVMMSGHFSFSDDGSKIAAVNNSTITVLDLNTGKVLQTLRRNARATSSLAVSRDGHLLATGGEDNETKLWDLTLGREVRRFAGQIESLDLGATAVAFSPDERWLASDFTWTAIQPGVTSLVAGKPILAEMYAVTVWDVATGQESRTLDPFRIGVSSISVSPDGHLLAAGDFMGDMKIWETGTWKVLESSEVDRLSSAKYVAFSPDGHWLAATGVNTLAIWDATTHHWANSITQTGYVYALAFSSDSTLLASADYAGHKIDIWEVNSHNLVLSIPGQTAEVKDLAFSSDGRWLATAEEDHTVRLFETTSGRELRRFAGHSSGVNAVAFTPDGHWLISASTDGSVRVWNPSDGGEVALLSTISGSDDWIVVTPEGLFEGSKEGALKLVTWRIGNSVYPADRFFASNYTPGLLSRILGGEKPKSDLKLEALKLPPEVRITSPSSSGKFKNEHIDVVVEAKDQGGGITEVGLFQNDKLVTRRPGAGSGKYQFGVDLVAGENVLRATALSEDRVEANDDQVRVVAEAVADALAPAKPALRLLVAGVSEYEDPAFDLNFARPDAEAIAGFFAKDKLFNPVDSIKLYDQAASKAAIQAALEKLAERAQQSDVIIIYLAGHGVGLGEQFYFLPHDMRRETDDDAAIRKYGIPASAVADALFNAKAQKEVLILDTCESEGALPLLAKAMTYRSRGVSAAEEKAVKMLARSYGVYLIAASTKQQEAYEVPELGHGVLTYALLSGLGEKGEPKAPMVTEGIITVGSLVEYVYAQVPDLTEKYRHQKQYVVTFTTGTNFPLWSK